MFVFHQALKASKGYSHSHFELSLSGRTQLFETGFGLLHKWIPSWKDTLSSKLRKKKFASPKTNFFLRLHVFTFTFYTENIIWHQLILASLLLWLGSKTEISALCGNLLLTVNYCPKCCYCQKCCENQSHTKMNMIKVMSLWYARRIFPALNYLPLVCILSIPAIPELAFLLTSLSSELIYTYAVCHRLTLFPIMWLLIYIYHGMLLWSVNPSMLEGILLGNVFHTWHMVLRIMSGNFETKAKTNKEQKTEIWQTKRNMLHTWS